MIIMEEQLPNEFDLVVVGTGLSESIIAAAASRVGKTVLHIDPNEFYGTTWSSFNLEAFQKFINDCSSNDERNSLSTTTILNQKIDDNVCGIKAAQHKWHFKSEIKEDTCEINEDEWTKEKVLKEFRKFNIDLTPKLLFSAGKLVELLISSNICRYAEFRSVDKICTIFDGQVKNVPCSRTDVFNTKDLTIVEKRLLMKLLSECMAYDDEKSADVELNENKTFLDFLKSQRLTDKIIHCVLHAISMSDQMTTFKEGMESTKNFLQSLGRYGNTPFLFPMYGCGEIPQCFCRLCAVFGGVYCLKKSIDDINFIDNDDEKRKIEICLDQQKIKIDYLIIGNGNNIPNKFLTECPIEERKNYNKNCCGRLSRAMLISSTPIGDDEMNSGGGGVNLLRIPSKNDDSKGALVIQLSHYSGTCPKKLYLIHVTAESKTDNPEIDLKSYIDEISNLENPLTILYSAFFQISECKCCSLQNPMKIIHNNNVHLTCGPYFELDYNLSIENAKNIFNKIYPNDEFLPRAPDPEEIIIGDEDPTAVKNIEILQETLTNEFQDGIEEKVESDDENEEN